MRAILTFSLLVLFCLPAIAQDEGVITDPDVNKVLVIKHRAGEKKDRVLKQGKVVKLFMHGGELVAKGRFTIDGEFIIINDNAYKMADIDYLRVSPRATKISGGILTGFGGVVVVSGTVVTSRALIDDDACSLIGGLLLIAVGLVPTVIGVPLLFVGKKYDLQHKWEVSTATLETR